jgi:hypothetical protein
MILRTRTIAAVPVLAAGAMITLAACGGPTVAKAPSTPAAPPSSAPAAPPSTPAPPPSTPAAQDTLTGPLGTVFTVTSTDNSGNPVSYDVTADKVLDRATGADEFSTPDPGNRFVGVKFTIAGDAGYSTDDANNDAVLQGSDGQVYTADFNSISAGTNFNSGDFSVTAGRTQTGWVTFQVPDGVSVTSVQWQPGLGDQQPATWDL